VDRVGQRQVETVSGDNLRSFGDQPSGAREERGDRETGDDQNLDRMGIGKQ